MAGEIEAAVQARAGAVTPAKADLSTVVKETLERQSTAFQTVLPGETDPKRFTRLVISAVKATPQLMRCFITKQGQDSLLIAAMQAASVGLEPNTVAQDAWILPRKNKQVDEAQLIVGYRGLLKLVRRSGQLKHVSAHTVHANDLFEYHYGLESDHLLLREAPAFGRGELTHVYAIARFTNGGVTFVVLNEEDVHKRRAMSPSYNSPRQRAMSPWVTWTEAMWRKSALRALVPYLELSPEEMGVIAADESRLRFDSNVGAIVADEETFELPESDDEPEEEGDEEDDDVETAQAAAARGAVARAQAEVKLGDLLTLAAKKGIVAKTSVGGQRTEFTAWVNSQLGTTYKHPGMFMPNAAVMEDLRNRLTALPDAPEGAF